MECSHSILGTQLCPSSGRATRSRSVYQGGQEQGRPDGQTPQHRRWQREDGARTESPLGCLRILAGGDGAGQVVLGRLHWTLLPDVRRCRDWPQWEASVGMLLDSAEKRRGERRVHPLPAAAHVWGEPTPALPPPTVPAPVGASHGPKPVRAQGR